MVKLNNPLMGTETLLQHDNCCHQMLKYVKLNNPLMGTETIANEKGVRGSGIAHVKLNNPLMGTETKLAVIVTVTTPVDC